MAKRTLRQQASAIVRSRTALNPNDSKEKSAPGNYKVLQSIRSTNEVTLALTKIAEDLNVSRIKQITPEIASIYLNEKRDNYASQKSLDRDRKALSIALGVTFPRVKAISENILKSRAYNSVQIKAISQSMTEKNAIALKLAHEAGLRAHELLTIKRSDEGQKSSSRTWTDKRFTGREGLVYIVTGKGGLVREVLLSREMAGALEARRLEQPVTKSDRGVNYLQRYDIGGGNALSSSFTRASQRALGFSHGIHGVRHSYAQERIDEVKYALKLSHEAAREIVAQELGHFRGDITDVYLR
ncbi:integrase domain-containing protein [Shewanella xiamenensis]|uniref:integrase domain-containing protein n=1 Tax=Shewanella xiamenensis TaxID=332186 RepID=UPI0021C03BCC|nr:integrase domain-containing protein [Shewanella xiamenensis]MCT8873768.1 integrase domain-containing protein [Shewanella xiamenensis]